MRDRKKRNIIIGALCSLLVFMGIGYAILSQTLNISGIANMQGNWNVKITNMELLSDNKTGRAEEVSHSFTDTTATFEANLYMPGDSIEYRVTVENQGNIDALLKSITPTVANRNVNIKFSHSEIDNTVLTAGKTITFTMKVEFLEDASVIPNIKSSSYSIKLVYVQYNGGDYTPAVETASDDCFMISDDGTLLSYDKECGLDVAIPATINGISVKRTALNFLSSDGVVAAFTTDSSEIMIFMNQSKQEQFFKYMKDKGISDQIIEEQRSSSYIWGDVSLDSVSLMTVKNYIINNNGGDKISKDSSGTIKLENSSSDANVFTFYYTTYCDTNDTCELVREYYRSKDPAKDYGITDNSYFEYIERDTTGFIPLDNANYTFYQGYPVASNLKMNTVDFSQAIYLEELDGCFEMNSDGNSLKIKKIILPPNVEEYRIYSAMADEIIFPNNAITKIIGHSALLGVKGKLPSTLKVIEGMEYSDSDLIIPASVVRLGHFAFQNSNLSSVTFESNSNLIAIYGDEGNANSTGAFKQNNLTSLVIPKSVQYIGNLAFARNNLTSVKFEANSELKYLDQFAFSDNSNLTQITLTSPTDIAGWTNGSTVNGIKVVYER